MEDRDKQAHPQSLVPLLSLAPMVVLLILSYTAFRWYDSGIDMIPVYQRNLYEPWMIACIVWLVAAASIAILLVMELKARAHGKERSFPPVAMFLAAEVNIILGILGLLSPAFICGLDHVAPENRLSATIFLASMTYGLLLSGIACIEYESLKGESGTSARRLCAVNFFFPSCLLAIVLLLENKCLGGG